MAEPNILLFDIDGTLLRIQRAFMHELLRDVMNSLDLDHSVITCTPFAGRTDRSIFEALAGRNCSESHFLMLKSRYIAAMKNRLKKENLCVFEHVRSTLEYFRARNYKMGLLTGNFREIAAIKLELAGLDSYFTFGAFGCDHADRNRLGPEARKDFHQKHRQVSHPHQYIIVGDTPLDVICAREFGCCSVAVTTGTYSREELCVAGPDLILDDLRQPERWLQELNGIERRPGNTS